MTNGSGSPREHRRARVFVSAAFWLIALVTLSLAVTGGDPIPASAAEPERGQEAKSDAESEQNTHRLLPSLMGATPEARARLDEERKRISTAAASFGTDPTAIIGYYQLLYGHNEFTNNLRLDNATAVVQIPITPNWFVRASLPYVWADFDQPRGFTTNGTSDMTLRTGGRLFANEDVALFIGTDVSFPTASEKQLGTGKYTLGPGGGVAVPLPRLRSLFSTLVQDFNSIGGDPSRANIHFMQVQSVVNTIWSERWWTSAVMTWNMDWNHDRKTTMNLLGEVGHQFDNHWNVFVGPGVGVAGRESVLGLDWTVQAGVRWVYSTPLFPERILESFPRQ